MSLPIDQISEDLTISLAPYAGRDVDDILGDLYDACADILIQYDHIPDYTWSIHVRESEYPIHIELFVFTRYENYNFIKQLAPNDIFTYWNMKHHSVPGSNTLSQNQDTIGSTPPDPDDAWDRSMGIL